mgnify:CR=1 FL=1|jgi:FkbM family methyltransferase
MQKILFKIVNKIFHKTCFLLQIELPVKYFGTPYGGWHISEKHSKSISTVLSAGVGEDISFDIEIINNFKSQIFFIDPTPRAIAHIDKVIENLGKHKTVEYDQKSGIQPVESYELSEIQIDNISLIKKALYSMSELNIKFFKPPNEAHVSHSISNFQNQFKRNTEYIEVKTTTIKDIMDRNKINKIDILKMDIEGAENQVIPDFLRRKIYPEQILVEFDELSTRFIRPYLKALLIFSKLYLNSYKLVNTDNFPNFLFVRDIENRL